MENTQNNEENLADVYSNLGVKKDDVVFLHINPLPFGLVANTKEDFVKFFIDPLREVLGSGGTFAVLTYTYSYGLEGKPYIHEESPSEAGILTEAVRQLPGALRSLHPLISITALGSKAEYITQNVTRDAFGWGSPFSRLHELKAKCLYVGMTCGVSCSFLHYVEQMFGVSHCYNKAYFHPVYKNGAEVKGPFLAFVRNRKSKPYDYSGFESEMKTRGHVRDTKYKGAPLQVVELEQCFLVGMEMLDRDPCAFIQEPFYITK